MINNLSAYSFLNNTDLCTLGVCFDVASGALTTGVLDPQTGQTRDGGYTPPPISLTYTPQEIDGLDSLSLDNYLSEASTISVNLSTLSTCVNLATGYDLFNFGYQLLIREKGQILNRSDSYNYINTFNIVCSTSFVSNWRILSSTAIYNKMLSGTTVDLLPVGSYKRTTSPNDIITVKYYLPTDYIEPPTFWPNELLNVYKTKKIVWDMFSIRLGGEELKNTFIPVSLNETIYIVDQPRPLPLNCDYIVAEYNYSLENGKDLDIFACLSSQETRQYPISSPVGYCTSEEGFWVFDRVIEPQIINGLKISTNIGNLSTNIIWGDGTNQIAEGGDVLTHTYTNNKRNTVYIEPISGATFESIIRIDCNLGVPINNRVGGTINLSDFPNLTGFHLSLTKVEKIMGIEESIKLIDLLLSNNNITQPIINITNYPNLRVLSIQGNNFTGQIPTLPPTLKTINCSDNILTGIIPPLPVTLESFNCSNQSGEKISGEIPNLFTLPNLEAFNCNNNKITSIYTPFRVLTTISEFNAANNLLSTDAIDEILGAFVAAGRIVSGGEKISLQGNSPPSAVGLAYQATLSSAGWIVNT